MIVTALTFLASCLTLGTAGRCRGRRGAVFCFGLLLMCISSTLVAFWSSSTDAASSERRPCKHCACCKLNAAALLNADCTHGASRTGSAHVLSTLPCVCFPLFIWTSGCSGHGCTCDWNVCMCVDQQMPCLLQQAAAPRVHLHSVRSKSVIHPGILENFLASLLGPTTGVQRIPATPTSTPAEHNWLLPCSRTHATARRTTVCSLKLHIVGRRFVHSTCHEVIRMLPLLLSLSHCYRAAAP